MKKTQKFLSVFLAAVLMLCIVPISANAQTVASDTCGDNITWVLDETGTLTISGTGEMYDYGYYSPWAEYRNMLKSVEIMSGVTSIGNEAFARCSSLTSINIPNSVTNIGYLAFYGCNKLVEIIVSPENDYYSSNEGVLFNKDQTTLICYPGGKTGTYKIPDSVTNICSDAFAGCSSLTSVTIPNSVTSINYETFSGCSSLTSVTIPNSVTSIDNRTFSGCSSLTSINIPDSVTSISAGAFEDCSSLTYITIPDSVTSIGDRAFYYCKSLTSVTIPDSVISIGKKAFYFCENLTSVTIPDSVTNICSDAFAGCSSLTSVTIPDSVTSIGDWAFKYCSSLTYITIPDSVTSIGFGAFCCCSSLTSVTIPDSVTSIGSYVFEYCSSLTYITIPDSVTSIGYNAFYNCSNLTDVYYTGSEEQWNEIEISNYYNDCLLNATIHYNHKHSYSLTKTVTAKCETDGYKLYECACGDSYKETLKATGHTYGAWTVKTPATVNKEGVEQRVCKTCGNAETRSIAKLKPTETPTITVTQSADVKKLSGNKIAVSSDMTIAQLLTALSNGVSIPGGTTVPYTGMKIELKNDGKVVDTVTLVVKGDIDGKDGVTAADARLALRRSVGLENYSGIYLDAADVDGDGKITAGDARLILRASVGLEKKLPANT